MNKNNSIIKQIPAMVDDEAHFALMDDDPYQITLKPHGQFFFSLCVYFSVPLSVYPCARVSVCLCVSLSVSITRSINLCLYLSIYLSIYLYLYLYLYLSIYIYIYLTHTYIHTYIHTRTNCDESNH